MAEVTKSQHCDVMVGDCGVVSEVFDDGYGIRFHGEFTVASDVNSRHTEDRVVFFAFDQVKTPEAKLQDPKLFATLQTLQQKIQDDINARTKSIPTRN